MLKKVYRLVLFLIIVNISFMSYSQVKEVTTIEEYSKQFLDESFVLEDMKKEEENKLENETVENQVAEENKENTNIIENNIEHVEENIVEETVETANPEQEITNLETTNENLANEEISQIKEIESVEEDISEEEYQQEMAEIEKKEEKKVEKKRTDGKINWDLPDNFRAVIIGDLNGNVFYAKNADKTYPLASITKVMTLMVTFDEIKAGRVSLKDKVKITSDVAKHGGSGIPMKAGQIFTLEDLIKASAIYSANNATYAIAKYVGKGSVTKFIGMMNKKAEKYGLQKEIKYYTPAGLPTRMTKKPMDSGTARGIYKLSIEALKYKSYIEIAGIKNTKIHSGKISIRNRNHLIGKEGVYGIKTGFHKEAKFNITVASNIDGMDIVIVVLGGESYTSRDKVVLDLIEIFKENYYVANILDKEKIIGKIKVEGTNVEIPVVPDKNYQTALKNNQNYRIEIKQKENLKLNISKGDDLGEYQVYVDDKVILKGRALAQKAARKL